MRSLGYNASRQETTLTHQTPKTNKPKTMKSKITILVSAAALTFAIFAAPVAMAEDGHNHDHGKKEEKNTKAYSLDTCIVSGDKLGEMGKPVVFEYKGQEIKLCCKDCRKDFDKDPAKYLKKLEEKKNK